MSYVCQVCQAKAKWMRDSFYTGKEYFCHTHFVEEIQMEYLQLPHGHDYGEYYDHEWVELFV